MDIGVMGNTFFFFFPIGVYTVHAREFQKQGAQAPLRIDHNTRSFVCILHVNVLCVLLCIRPADSVP